MSEASAIEFLRSNAAVADVADMVSRRNRYSCEVAVRAEGGGSWILSGRGSWTQVRYDETGATAMVCYRKNVGWVVSDLGTTATLIRMFTGWMGIASGIGMSHSDNLWRLVISKNNTDGPANHPLDPQRHPLHMLAAKLGMDGTMRWEGDEPELPRAICNMLADTLECQMCGIRAFGGG